MASAPGDRWLASGGDDYCIWLRRFPSRSALRVYRDPAACISLWPMG
ncbi:hypothetical protein [Synechococcus sp. B60.1]